MTAPLHWTVRVDKRAGAVRSHVLSKFGPAYGHRRLTVWIHGFNTSESSALDVWEKTHDAVREIGEFSALRGTVWFFWPGDGAKSRTLSACFYPLQVETAAQAGKVLGEHIVDLQLKNPQMEIDLVAHSLGCRVAAAAASHVRRANLRQVRELLLFAAAIPEGLCGGNGIYSNKMAKTERVYYSRADEVLKVWFPLGQSFARKFAGELDPGVGKTAVGYKGGPTSRWTTSTEAVGYAHSDYWSKEESLSAIGSLYGVARRERRPRNKQLKYRVIGSRPLTER